MIIQATAVLHNFAIQRKQHLPIESTTRTSKLSHNQPKDNVKRKYFTEVYNSAGLIDRDNFIAKHFPLQ